MNKKVLTLSAVMASMLFGAAAHAADTRIGVDWPLYFHTLFIT